MQSGVLDLLDPKPEQIHLDDIGRALSNICRYTGHVHSFYSVAEHSLLVGALAFHEAGEVARLAGLFHDAHEAYIGDLSSPFKAALARRGGDLPSIENKIIAAINARFGLSFDLHVVSVVHAADQLALSIESQMLLPNPAKFDREWPRGSIPVGTFDIWNKRRNTGTSHVLTGRFHAWKETVLVAARACGVSTATWGD